MLVNIHNKYTGKLLKLALLLITMLLNKDPVLQFISIFSQISAKKFQVLLFEIVFIDYFLFIPTFNISQYLLSFLNVHE